MKRVLRLGGPSALVIVAILGFLLPARASSGDAGERVDAAQRLVDELEWEIEDLAETASSADALVAEQDALRVAVPDDHDLAGVILDLQAATDAAGIELLDVVPTSVLGSFDDPLTPTGTSSVVLAVALRGEYAEVIDLLEALTNHERLFVVDAVSLGVDEVSGALAIDLEIRVFTTKELVEFTDEFLDDEFDEEEAP